MKELIVKVLERYPDINLASDAARYILAEAILTEISKSDEGWFLDMGIDVSSIKNKKKNALGVK